MPNNDYSIIRGRNGYYILNQHDSVVATIPLPVIISTNSTIDYYIYGCNSLFDKLLTAYIYIDLMPERDVYDILGGDSNRIAIVRTLLEHTMPP